MPRISHTVFRPGDQVLLDFRLTGEAGHEFDLGAPWHSVRTLHDPLDYKPRALGERESTGSTPVNLYT